MSDRELQYKIRAISLALEKWNDAEALRLLRLAWADIEAALKPEARSARKKVAPSGMRLPKIIDQTAASQNRTGSGPQAVRADW